MFSLFLTHINNRGLKLIICFCDYFGVPKYFDIFAEKYSHASDI